MRFRAPSRVKAKLQDPRSKLQRTSKLQLGVGPNVTAYPEASERALVLNEANDGGAAKHPFDLEERTAVFGEAIVRFVKKVPHGPENNRLIDQLVGCGTSIGANYCEANEGLSRKDFHCTIGRCRKEAKFFLRMIAASEPKLAIEARELFREAKELHLIFCAMFRNSG
jgi:four helix bundle protein